MLSRVPDKLALAALMLALSVVASWQINAVLFLALLLLPRLVPAYHPSGDIYRARFWRFIRYAISLVILIILLNGIFIREGATLFKIGPLHLSEGGLLFGANTGLRLLVITTALLSFLSSTPLRSIAGYLQHTGLPSQLVMALLLTLHFLDQLPRRIETIYTAQEARGAPVRAHIVARVSAFFSVLAPLVLSSITESIDRGIALELRGFRAHTALRIETPAEEYRGTWMSFALLTASLAVLIFAFVRWLLR